MGFCETGFGKTGFGKTGFGETGFCETGFCETGFCETGFGETGFGETGFGETGGHLDIHWYLIFIQEAVKAGRLTVPLSGIVIVVQGLWEGVNRKVGGVGEGAGEINGGVWKS